MEDKDVNAEWARKEAQSILGDKVKAQLITCVNSIRAAVKRNEFTCHVTMYADKLTILELEKRGFSCKQTDDQRDGSYVTISW